MPLEILGPLVVLGIAGIALLLHWLGLTAPRHFRTEDDVRRAWAREFPNTPPQDILMSSDAKAALILLGNRAGLTWCFGDDTVSRLLRGHETTITPSGLRIALADFGAPQVNVTLTSADLAKWQEAMNSL